MFVSVHYNESLRTLLQTFQQPSSLVVTTVLTVFPSLRHLAHHSFIHSLLIASGVTSSSSSSTCHSSHTSSTHTTNFAFISYTSFQYLLALVYIFYNTLPHMFISNVAFPTLTTFSTISSPYFSVNTSSSPLFHTSNIYFSLRYISNTLHTDNIALSDTTFPTHCLQHSLHFQLYFLHTSLPTAKLPHYFHHFLAHSVPPFSSSRCFSHSFLFTLVFLL